MSSSPRVHLSPPTDQRISLEVERAIERAVCAPHVAVVTSVPFLAFVNRLGILGRLEKEDLVEAKVIETQAEWSSFSRNPAGWLVRASDEKAAALWLLTEREQPPHLRSLPIVTASAAAIGEAA